MLLYGWTIVILYLYIINGRLEADVNKSVESHCVLLKSSHHRYNHRRGRFGFTNMGSKAKSHCTGTQ